MSTKLGLHKGDLTKYVEKNGLSDVIKPLVNRIHLFDTHVAGTSFIKETEILQRVQIGSRLDLR